MTTTSIIPTYQRFVNGVPVPSFSRRSFRPREKYLILLVFLTLGGVCFGAFFYLPEFKNSTSAVNNRVMDVYQQMQKAGPELLIPEPPIDNQLGDVPQLVHHNDYNGLDPHLLDDRERLQMKIDQDQSLKVLERPYFPPAPSSSVKSYKADNDIMDIPGAEGGGIENNIDNNIDDHGAKMVTVPPEPAAKYPVVNKGEDPDPVIRERRDKVKEMMKHAWDNYKLYAWGKNELRPLSKKSHNTGIFGAGNLGASIVDGLDTLYIMGLDKEFQDGKEWISENLTLDLVKSDLSVFETNIRFVGGLLTCFALTGDVMFRDRAVEVVDHLLPAFGSPTGIPYSLVNPATGATKNFAWASGGSSILSEIGTLHLEFTYLSDVTGNPIYVDKVNHIRKVLKEMEKPNNGLYPNFINPKTGKWGQHHMSMGGLGDSFYEYLLKAWIQSGQKDVEAREMYDETMDSVMKYMLKKSPGGLYYIADLKYDRVLEEKMDHLTCFAGGLFGIASNLSQSPLAERYMQIAKEITHTCHESYDRSTTKLGPEAFRFTEGNEAKAMKSNEKYYILRPETLESYFIMWRLTKDNKYREWGWEAVQALEKYCRVEGGYSGIRNVYQSEPQRDDVQQSFFLAETLKYLYLLFSDDSLISLDEWVFNTEAHPLPIKGKNPLYRQAEA